MIISTGNSALPNTPFPGSNGNNALRVWNIALLKRYFRPPWELGGSLDIGTWKALDGIEAYGTMEC